MLTAEMAMKRQYQEITGKVWKGALVKLIDWLYKNHYFDVYNDYFLQHYRQVRNSMAHVEGYSFAGPMMKQWILHTVV